MVNIFVTDTDPVVSARNLDDKRVGKLLMEANQLMSLAVKIQAPSHTWEPRVGASGLVSGFAHLNHPLTSWVAATTGNFEWTHQWAKALDEEWRYRFDSQHSSGLRIETIWSFREYIPGGDLQPFANHARNHGLQLDFTYLPVPYSYRHYVQSRWKTDRRAVVFTRRQRPAWARKSG